MLPRWHIIFGLVFSLVLLRFNFSIYALAIAFLASFLIDIDHYLFFVVYKKTLSPVKFLAFIDKVEETCRHSSRQIFYLCIFHTIEFIILIAVLAFFFDFFFFVFLGFSLHLILDVIDISVKKRNFLKMASLIYYISNSGKMVKI